MLSVPKTTVTRSPPWRCVGFGTSNRTPNVSLAGSATALINTIFPSIVDLSEPNVTCPTSPGLSFIATANGAGTSTHNGSTFTIRMTLVCVSTASPALAITSSTVPSIGERIVIRSTAARVCAAFRAACS